jgi:eukaryotic-like serine/threonine-protein kinase
MVLPKTLGRYEILEEVGRGSMGVVYKARDPRIGRVVALKTFAFSFPLGPGEEEEFLQRFYHEAQVAGRLNHPNIVTIHDVGEKGAEGDAYIAMEYVTGTNLHDLLAGGGRLPLAQVADVVGSLARALDYAHENGVIHRDIKPANIVLTETGQPKILDFGIARVAAGGLTRPGRFFGTPNYMSPEQVTGVGVDGRTDQFSLAVILYQLLTGEKPFSGESVTAISYQVVNVDPPPPSKLNPALSPAFDRILRKALAKRPDDRYPRGEGLAEDLATTVREWREAADRSVPPTLVSEGKEQTPPTSLDGGVRGITFLAPRWSQLMAPGGAPLGVGWIVFLLCLGLLASTPFLLQRAPAGRSGGSPVVGLLTAPLGPGGPKGLDETTGLAVLAGAEGAMDQAQAARLNLSLSHRFVSGRVVVRIDGRPVLDESIRGTGSRILWSRSLPVAPGRRRVEVRVVSGDRSYDDIEGIDVSLRPKQAKDLRLSLGGISRRLKLRFEDPGGRVTR